MRQRVVSDLMALLMLAPCRRRLSRARPSAWPGRRPAGRRAPGRHGRGPQPGHRHVPRDGQGEDGTFIASGIVPGTYQVDGRAAGLQEIRTAGPRARGRQDLQHRRGAGGRRGRGDGDRDHRVAARRRDLEGDRRQHHQRDAGKLPSVNGNFIGFVGLLPGIVPSISTESFGSDSISVNGQDPRNNNYIVDGGNNNDDVIGQRAGTQARTPIEAIQEFQVITGQYDAEFGRTSGAVVNAVTKAGTNQFRGSAFGFFQDGSLTTKDFFAKEKGPGQGRHQYQRWGGTVGGPIVHDKMHFFVSLERFAIDRPNTIDIPARPDLNGTQIDRGSRVEHDHPRRPPDQQQHHLQRPLAARDLAAEEPDHRPAG